MGRNFERYEAKGARKHMFIGRIMLGVFLGSVGTYMIMIILDQVMKAKTRATLFMTLLSLVLATVSCVYLIIMNILAI